MKKTIRFFRVINIILILSIIAISVSIFSAGAYVTTGVKLNTDYVFSFVPHQSFTDLTIEHFRNSTNSWNDAADLTLMSVSGARHNETGYPNNDNKHYVYKEVRSDLSVPGQTTCYNSAWPHGNVLKSADVLINSHFKFVNSQREDRFDTWSVFVHEAGHVAGLDHTNYTQDASIVMFPQAFMNFLRRYPQWDDINGINAIY